MNVRAVKISLVFLLALIIVESVYASDYILRWNYSTEGGVIGVAVDDLDGDGFKEIIAATAEDTRIGNMGGAAGSLYVLKDNGELKWSKASNVFGWKINSLLVGDLEGDNRKEVIVGAASKIHFFDSGGAGSKIDLQKYGYEVNGLLMEDVNRDGVKELIVFAHSSDNGGIFLYNSKKNRLWGVETPQELTAYLLWDLDNDGVKEFVAGTTGRRDAEPAYVYVYNNNGKLVWSYRTNTAVKSFASVDLDGDGLEELIAGGKDLLYVFDGKGNLKKNVSITGNINKILVGDINRDGQKDIVVGSSAVYLLDKNLNKYWATNVIGAETNKLGIYDINSDGWDEVIAATNGLFFINKEGVVVDQLLTTSTVRDFALSDLTSDGYPELVASTLGRTSGRVLVYYSQVGAKKTDARRNMNQAKELLGSGNFSGAEEKARAARKVFVELRDDEGKREADDLIQKIVASEALNVGTRKEADEAYNVAHAAFTNQNPDYVTALSSARIAKEKYLLISDTENSRRADEIIKGASEALRMQADELLSTAKKYFEGADYRNAFFAANKSLSYFTALRDSERIKDVTELMTSIENASGMDFSRSARDSGIQLDGNTQDILLIALVAVFLLASFFLISGFFRRRKFRGEGKKPKKKVSEEIEEEGLDNIIDDVEEDEKIKKKQREKEEIEEKASEEKKEDAWINVNTIKKAQKNIYYSTSKKEDSQIKNRKKHLEKITKDGFRGVGVSLRSLGVKAPEEALKEEEDISD